VNTKTRAKPHIYRFNGRWCASIAPRRGLSGKALKRAQVWTQQAFLFCAQLNGFVVPRGLANLTGAGQ